MTRLTLIGILVALSVAACGKKGDLRPPPGYEPPAESAPVPAESEG